MTHELFEGSAEWIASADEPSPPVLALCANNDGRVVSGGGDGAVRVWSLLYGDLLSEVRRAERTATTVSMAGTGDSKLVVGLDGAALLMDFGHEELLL